MLVVVPILRELLFLCQRRALFWDMPIHHFTSLSLSLSLDILPSSLFPGEEGGPAATFLGRGKPENTRIVLGSRGDMSVQPSLHPHCCCFSVKKEMAFWHENRCGRLVGLHFQLGAAWIWGNGRSHGWGLILSFWTSFSSCDATLMPPLRPSKAFEERERCRFSNPRLCCASAGERFRTGWP